jgi:uncharacterized membrane protein
MSGAANTPAADMSNARTFALIGYALFIAAFMNGITAIVGVVLAYIKRDEVRGTIWESHFNNLIGVFWTAFVAGILLLAAFAAGVFGIVAASEHNSFNGAVALLPLAGIAGVLFVIWYLYRCIKGLMRAIDGQSFA